MTFPARPHSVRPDSDRYNLTEGNASGGILINLVVALLTANETSPPAPAPNGGGNEEKNANKGQQDKALEHESKNCQHQPNN